MEPKQKTTMNDISTFNLFEMVNKELSSTTADPAAHMPALPEDVGEFLGKLSILQGVPVHYLIPNERFLQLSDVEIVVDKHNNILKEGAAANSADARKIIVERGALKLFYLDPEWIQCLLNGALSIADDDDKKLLSKAMEGKYAALVHYNQVKDQIKKQINGRYTPKEYEEELKKRLTGRNLVYGNPAPTDAQKDWAYTGFIIRSSVISSWTGVEVIASGTIGKKTNQPLRVVRVDKLADNTVLCICEGTITDVEITQPAETIYLDTRQLNLPGVPQRGNGILDINKIVNPTPHLLNSEMKNSAALTEKLLSKPLKTKLKIIRN
jgi:hypothetical protein